jgi:hypothetical protein
MILACHMSIFLPFLGIHVNCVSSLTLLWAPIDKITNLEEGSFDHYSFSPSMIILI